MTGSDWQKNTEFSSYTKRNRKTAIRKCLISMMTVMTRFAYIAGYTSGGAAYGLQWEDVGIDLDLPFDEKVRLYRSGTY